MTRYDGDVRRARRALMVLAAAGFAAQEPSVARGEPEPGVISGEPVAPAGTETTEPPPEPTDLPRVVEVSPVGDRVEPDAPVVVRFERDVPEQHRRGLLTLEPPTAVRERWLDARTLALDPGAWRMGRAQRVSSGAKDGAVEWTFRTRVTAPRGVLAGNGRRLVFTFDDGPNDRRQADRLLDRLKELGIRAIFFPTGRWTSTRPDWVERAKREGHRVCNHTQNHVNLTAPWMTEARIRAEIEGGASDGDCRLFRPPLLGIDRRVQRIAAELGYELYLWDLDTRDWEGAPAEDIENLVLRGARPEAVVLFHIHAKATFQALPSLAEKLRAAGYVLSWDAADAASDGEAAGVGLGGSPGRREWGAELERPTAQGPIEGPDWVP